MAAAVLDDEAIFKIEGLDIGSLVDSKPDRTISQPLAMDSKSRQQGQAEDVLGQFQFAPATQTTVVTTTTTTTTRFPPFIMPRPRQNLDPKMYPLANTPTPSSLKKIPFEIDGRKTIFTEAEDTSMALEQYQQESQRLELSRGSVKNVKTFNHRDNHSLSTLTGSFDPYTSAGSYKRPYDTIKSEGKNGLAIHKAMESKARIAKSSSGGCSGYADDVLGLGPTSPGHTDDVIDSGPTSPTSPTTPPASERHNNNDIRKNKRKLDNMFSGDTLSGKHGRQQTFAGEVNTGSTQENPPRADMRQLRRLKTNTLSTPSSIKPYFQQNYSQRGPLPENVVPTPPIQDDDEILFSRPAGRGNLSSVPSRLTNTESASGQDGSLPSPSLSPITAAASIRIGGGYFADTDSSSDQTAQQDADVEDYGIYLSETPSRASLAACRRSPALGELKGVNAAARNMPFNDIPAMLELFESIPDELKGWVMHQLLRRCPKTALQVVADVVNPALKCDFLGLLPTELSLNILKYLDAQSLCRASQVSKKWRHIINTDEKAWKGLFDKDGFILAEGELKRAIVEGWGWQDPSGCEGWERDISAPTNRSDSDVSRPTTPHVPPSIQRQTLNALAGTANRRPKRKAAMKASGRSKQAKRRDTQDESDLLQPVSLLSQLSNREGPYNAANAASLAVPYPQVDFPSLKDMHLFKSLYRRHYVIRKSWMDEDVKPRHIAFRAHDRHVVTCLQFDTDKIITGSDDTNINVYDTKTGALRATLQGHEGGVWALQYEGNILVSGSTDRSVRVWDVERGRQTHVFQGHTSTVRCLQILLPTKVGETADGQEIMMPKQPLIITGSRDSNLRVWRLPQPGDPYYFAAGAPLEDADNPYFVRILSGHGHSVRAIAAHGDTLVSGSYDTTVRVWKISTGEVLHRLQGHSQKVYSVVLDHSRNRCISGSMDNLVKIWSLETGTCIYTLDGHASLVGLLDLNSERLVSAAADSTLRIWDPENGQCKATLSAHTGAITCFQHDGQKVISGSDRTLKMWNVKTGECVKDLLTDLTGVWQVKFNDRRCVAAVQRENMTYVEVLDFGASRDGVTEKDRGRRIVVDINGEELPEQMDGVIDLDTHN